MAVMNDVAAIILSAIVMLTTWQLLATYWNPPEPTLIQRVTVHFENLTATLTACGVTFEEASRAVQQALLSMTKALENGDA